MLAAALVVAGIALPGVLLAGAATTTVAQSVRSLPDGIDPGNPPQPSVLYAADGTTRIATFYSQYRRPVQLTQISKVMQQAMVAAEDRRFYEHGAVDAKGVLRAAAANLRNGSVDQGASTLTMQYVRNVLKNDQSAAPRARGRDPGHALPQAAGGPVRGRARAHLSKDRDPQQLPEHRLLRRRRVRDRGRPAERYFSTTAPSSRWPRPRCWPGWCSRRTSYNPIARDQKRRWAAARTCWTR